MEKLIINLNNLLKNVKEQFNGKDRKLNKPIAVVTGGAGGLGFQLAQSLSASNMTVICLDMKVPTTVSTNTIHFYKCDITNIREVKKIKQTIHRKFGTVNIIINNAGITEINDFVEVSDVKLKSVLHINLMGPFIVTHVFFNDVLNSENGAIVNISSVLGILTPARLTSYGASKAGLISFHKCLEDYFMNNQSLKKSKNVTKLLLVCPGKIRTNLFSMVNTPSTIIAPDIDPSCLANEIVDLLVNSPARYMTIMKPYYANIIPAITRLNWHYIHFLKYISGMNKATKTKIN